MFQLCPMEKIAAGIAEMGASIEEMKKQVVAKAADNIDGLRASIGAGEVTMGDVLNVLPFQNTLSTYAVTGAVMVAALENGVSQMEEVKGHFPQIAGLSFIINPSAEVGS